jgi:23S rRNA pseudouridine1911/1915/1917 synthase
MLDGWRIEVSDADAGARLDVLLARGLDVSRGYARRLLARGDIRLNARSAPKGVRVERGDVVEGPAFRHPSLGPRSSREPELRILKEERGLVAIDKPAGIPTHPLDYDETGTVLNVLLSRFPDMAGIGEGGLRPGLLHRLDTGTSGVLVFATERRSWERGRRAFSERRVWKRYLARVHGRLSMDETELVLRLEHRGVRMRVVEHGGRTAITWLRTLDAGSESLIEARPVTGLMHQIRVTLAHMGHPLLGDRIYGSDRDLGRHLLHATEIDIEGFRAESPPPPEVAPA